MTSCMKDTNCTIVWLYICCNNRAMQVSMGRSSGRPNILVTGTPATGKTALAALIAEKTGLRHVCVGDIIKEYNCTEEKDEAMDSYVLDEDRLIDVLEEQPFAIDEGGNVLDYHSAELFPERYFDLVLVLTCDTEVLYDRLTARGYSAAKREMNMNCEIMQVVLDEAKDSYAPEIVHALPSNTLEDMESNAQRAVDWMRQWMMDNSN